MLGAASIVAFVPTRDPAAARAFYEGVLELQFESADDFALVFRVGGVPLRVVNVAGVRDFNPAPFTILGWHVQSATETVMGLRGRGVAFQHYEGMNQDELEIWTSPSGARIAWFKDPDGNVLSISEY